jgi:hypothetical protein
VTVSVRCIYPGPHGGPSAEHYLPAALGTFEGCKPLQGRVCQRCNRRIGDQTELQFLRAGQIGFFRWMLGIEGRSGLPPSPFDHGAGGAPRLVALGRIPQFRFLVALAVDPGTENVYPLRQIVFDGPIAGSHPVVILDSMRDNPEALRAVLTERGLLDHVRPIHAFAAEDEIDWMRDLMRAFGGQPTPDWTTLDFQGQRIEVVVQMKVTDAHFRAVAKIAFHYVLSIFPDLTGAEQEFSPIRDFIWAGGNADRFVRQRRAQFIANFGRARPTHWMHILAVTRYYGGIIVNAQFFAGRRSLPPPYEIAIGRDPRRIFSRPDRRAHMFVILDPRAPAGVVGRMEDAEPTNYIFVP